MDCAMKTLCSRSIFHLRAFPPNNNITGDLRRRYSKGMRHPSQSPRPPPPPTSPRSAGKQLAPTPGGGHNTFPLSCW